MSDSTKAASVIAVFNQVVLPAFLPTTGGGMPGEAQYKLWLQTAEDIWKINNPGTRPQWAKDVLKD